MRVFCGTQTPSCSLLVSYRLLACKAETSRRTEGKLASPHIPVGRVEQGRRGCREVVDDFGVCKLLLGQKSQHQAVQEANPAREHKKGVGCSLRAAMRLPLSFTMS